jgi:lipopolysaccharide transport system permease protein
MPLAATFSATIDFAIASIVLIAMMMSSGLVPTWRVIALPGSVCLVLVSALGVGFWLSALNVRYRDVGHAIPFLLQVWMYASPVVYPMTLVPERWRLLYSLNPMVGAVDGFRWALLGKPVPDLQTIALSAGVAVLLLVLGLGYFRRVERTFADVI